MRMRMRIRIRMRTHVFSTFLIMTRLPTRIVQFGAGRHCFLLTKTRCLHESSQSYNCSTWKKFDWRDSNHAIRSRLVSISMLSNTNCRGNGNDLRNGNDFRNAIVSDHSHAWPTQIVQEMEMTSRMETTSRMEMTSGMQMAKQFRQLSHKTRMLNWPEPKLLMLAPKVKDTWRDFNKILKLRLWGLKNGFWASSLTYKVSKPCDHISFKR